MSSKPLEQIPEAWGDHSRSYDEHITPLLGPFAEQLVKAAKLKADSRVLEVAAGSGLVTRMLAGAAGHVLATDFAEGMIALLRERCADLDNVEARVMDGQALELDDDSFDVAVCNFGVIFFPDRVKGLSELHRVLKPGGTALVTGWMGPEHFPAFQIFGGAVARACPDLPKPASPPPVFSLADSQRFRDEMARGGFADIEVIEMHHVFEVPSAEAFWDMIRSSAPPAKAMLDNLGPEGAERVREELLAALRERFGDGPVRLKNGAHLAVGTKAS